MSSSRPPSYTSRSGFSPLSENDDVTANGKAARPPRLTPPNPSKCLPGWIWEFSYRHRHRLRAAPAAAASTLWIAMMLYFFVHYTTVLDKVDGEFPRIGPSYSVWPYISCIGAVRLRFFQGFAITVAILVTTAFGLDCWLFRDIWPGRWFRLAKASLAITSCVFLIALSYESVNNHSHLHLIFTSIQIWFMGAAKIVDDILNHTIRKHDPTNEHLLVAKRWKRTAGFVALLSGPVAVYGIYSCQVLVGDLPDTARCWKLVAWAAPCEWILSCCWSAYLYMVAYDLRHAEEVRESVVAKSGRRSREKLPSIRVRKALEYDGDNIPFASLQQGGRASRVSFGDVTEYAAGKEQAMLDEEDDIGLSRELWEARKTHDYVG